MSLAKTQVFFLPAVIQGSIIWLLYYMIGFDNVVRFCTISNKLGGQLDLHKNLFDVLPSEFNTQLYHLFHTFDIAISNIWCAILAIILVISCYQVAKKYGYKFGDGYRFWLKGQSTTTERAISYLMMIIIIGELPFVMVGRKFIFHNPILGLAMALTVTVGLFCMCYCQFYNHKRIFTLRSMTHADMPTVNPSNNEVLEQDDSEVKTENMAGEEVKSADDDSAEPTADAVQTKDEVKTAEENAEEEESQEDTDAEEVKNTSAKKIVTKEKSSSILSARTEAKNNNIALELRRLLEEEQIFTDKNLTLELLAKRMNTNRNKLSTIVNHVYGMDFRNVLAELRIEEAKTFMKANPTATADTIATHCGFKDTSAFFHRFKDIVGESPRMWISK